MKIVDRKTFLAMPEGTVFSKYQPCVFEEFRIKGETWGNDFLYQSLDAGEFESSGSDDWMQKLDRAEKDGIDLPLVFDGGSRDGCFDDDQLFAVLSESDVLALIEKIRATTSTTTTKGNA